MAKTADERAAPGVLGELAAVSPDVVCATDRQGRFLAVNAAWARVLGWTSDDLLGRPFLDFVHEDDRARTSAAWTRMLEGEPIVDFENRWPTRDGEWRWISWASMPSETGDHVYSTGRDITSRMEQLIRVTESESLLVAAERVARLGSWEWRLDGDVAYLSEELRRIFSVDREEPFSLERLLDLAHPDDRERLKREVGACTVSGEPLDIEYRIVQPDGQERIVRERGECVVEHGEVVRMFGTVQDVTEHRRLEAELRRVAEVEQQAATRLRELDRMKTAFLSAVSHELRTPLTVVQGMAATLRERGAALRPEARGQLEDALVEHAGRLGRLLEGLLDVDRLSRDAVGVERRDVDVAALVHQVVDRSPARERVELDLQHRLMARVDPLQFERILSNLLDNAAKYGGAGRIHVVVRPHTAQGCRLEVRDEGPGIPAGELGQVFEAFHRIDEDHPRPGTGIGLALVSEFARLHGGAAWAEQPSGRGAHLVVELPGDGLI